MTYKRVTDQVHAPASHLPLFYRSPERVSELLVVTQVSRKARGRVRGSWTAVWAFPAAPPFSAKAWEPRAGDDLVSRVAERQSSSVSLQSHKGGGVRASGNITQTPVPCLLCSDSILSVHGSSH